MVGGKGQCVEKAFIERLPIRPSDFGQPVREMPHLGFIASRLGLTRFRSRKQFRQLCFDGCRTEVIADGFSGRIPDPRAQVLIRQ